MSQWLQGPREAKRAWSGAAAQRRWQAIGGSSTDKMLPFPQAFLFTYYGLTLQAEKNSATVRRHLQALLETSHQWPKQREVRTQAPPCPHHHLTLTTG